MNTTSKEFNGSCKCQHHTRLARTCSCTHCYLDVAPIHGLQGAIVGPRAKDVADLVVLRAG